MIGVLAPAGDNRGADRFSALAAPQWVPAHDDKFPPRLVEIPNPAPGLWMRTGLASDLLARLWSAASVAIIGARAASAAGCGMARMLAWEAARAGILVVSGLARGIDGAAHEGALLAGGQTVAVLACGLEGCYPPEHSGLGGDVAGAGALLSEWGGSEEPLPWRFPRRNRLISGLADLVVLVEGSARSGARHTVRFALEQGREVMAVPRDPLLPGSVAPNRLLRDGAAPVTGAADMLAAVRQAAAARCALGTAPDLPRPAQAGAGLAGRLLGHLGREGRLTLELLATRVPEIAPGRLVASLTSLEVAGRIARDRQGRYLLAEVG